MHLYHFRSITQTLYGIMNIIVMLNKYCIQLKLPRENPAVSSKLTSYSVFLDTCRPNYTAKTNSRITKILFNLKIGNLSDVNIDF